LQFTLKLFRSAAALSHVLCPADLSQSACDL